MRRSATTALAMALGPAIEKRHSEAELRDAFDHELSKLDHLTQEGWYQPPPKGIIMVAGNPPHYDRLCCQSFRPADTWPSVDVTYDKQSILYAYGSRVHTQSGYISDFACSLYRGDDVAIRDHLRDVWSATMEIAGGVEIGMTYADVYAIASDVMNKYGATNNVLSASDPAGTNIGHSIPWAKTPPTHDELRVLQHGSPADIANLVNKKRCYVSAGEGYEIEDGDALTIEPRLSRMGMPMVNYHVVVGFERTKRAIVTEYNELFALFGMDGFSGA